MRIEFDPAKDVANLDRHGISLATAVEFDFATAFVVTDDRYDYGEARFQAYGLIEKRLHVLVFTMRGDVLRAISLRKANVKEVKRHGKKD